MFPALKPLPTGQKLVTVDKAEHPEFPLVVFTNPDGQALVLKSAYPAPNTVVFMVKNV
jgi:hypothetical protein